MKRCINTILAFLSLGMMIAFAVTAAPPAEETVTRAVEGFDEAAKNLDRSDWENHFRLRREAALAAMRGIDVSEASLAQLRRLKWVLPAAEMTDQALARLEVLARDTGKEGAEAAILRLSYLLSPRHTRQDETDADRENALKAQEAALRQVVDHPGLTASLAESGDVFLELRRVNRQVMASALPQMLQLVSRFPAQLSPNLAGNLVNFILALDGVQMEAADRQRLLGRLATALQAARNNASDDVRDRYTRPLQWVNGAFARGQLVGHLSPPLDITWSTLAEPIGSVAELKGKVVVLDFWATWCGPCIGLFPEVRELQARYKDSPVVILGVTSLQGYHMDRPDGVDGAARRIDTSDSPAQEYKLMETFIQQLGMTWPVAFTAQQVLNPEFGINGIPRLAILDPAGVVRYSDAGSDIAGKIDGLLREFNLPVPADAQGSKDLSLTEVSGHERMSSGLLTHSALSGSKGSGLDPLLAWNDKLRDAISVTGTYEIIGAGGESTPGTFKLLKPSFRVERSGQPGRGTVNYTDGVFAERLWEDRKVRNQKLVDEDLAGVLRGFESFFGQPVYRVIKCSELQLDGRKSIGYELAVPGGAQTSTTLLFDPSTGALLGYDRVAAGGILSRYRYHDLKFDTEMTVADVKPIYPADVSLPQTVKWTPTVEIGAAAPQARLLFPDDKSIAMKDLWNGRSYVLLNFLCFGCGDHVAELPYYDKLMRHLAPQGLKVFSIVESDRTNSLESHMKREGLSVPTLTIPDEKTLAAYRGSNLRSTYLVDKQGKVVFWQDYLNRQALERALVDAGFRVPR